MEVPHEPETPSTIEKTEFKKPILFGRVGKLPKKVKDEAERKKEEREEDEKQEMSIEKEMNNDSRKPGSSSKCLPPAVIYKDMTTPVPYKEPKWSGLCPEGSNYALEVLKSGMIVETIDLTSKPFHVFGRLANCDFILNHPTISRYHAVLQYKAFAEEGDQPSGWYIYDLGSTHGTFLNKDCLKPNHYTRVRVGHQIKFGNSTRTYIVLGPDYDCEGELNLSVTELKQKALQSKLDRDKMIEEAKQQREKDRLEEERKRVEQGIDWGMGEDAEEEPDLSENPYASTGNEELYLDDPKKTLRGYFEREGHELTYDCEERGVGQFLCKVELPIDDARGRAVIAEVLHRGKKKEAVIACAMEACRMLDRVGLLRQAKHESRAKKRRDRTADDYYSSDDDTFLDRTGAVERKRTRRLRAGAARAGDDTPLTYDDLLKQISEIEEKITSEEKLLERLRSANKPVNSETSETDALDEYMKSLGRQGQSMAQKAEISKTKMSIQKLKAELSKTQRLAEIARPAHLPPLVKKNESKMAVKVVNSVVYGKRIKLKEDLDKKPKIKTETKRDDAEFVEEVESDEEEKTEESKKDTNISTESVDTSESDKGPDTKVADQSEAPKRIYGPMRPPENYVMPEDYFNQESDRDLPEILEKE